MNVVYIENDDISKVLDKANGITDLLVTDHLSAGSKQAIYFDAVIPAVVVGIYGDYIKRHGAVKFILPGVKTTVYAKYTSDPDEGLNGISYSVEVIL